MVKGDIAQVRTIKFQDENISWNISKVKPMKFEELMKY